MAKDTAKNRQTVEDLASGTVLGRYQLLSAVGEGGMGRVWAARQVGSPLQRLVAVKTAIRSQGQTREFQRLFMDEARIASLIHHPHVCGVYELGEERGVMFLVMEWCDGASLRQVMDRLPAGKMTPHLAARIVANTAAGLHAAHELEDNDGTPLHVVHRDVSPQNILISKNGHVKVADFGVAKARGQLHKPTETGEMKGKLSYMAPEQVTAKDVDQRADIFALGCVLYESTLGRRPFHGEGALSTLYQLLEQTVAPPADIDPEYPQELSDIVLKALSKDPEDRYQTAEQLRVALEGWLTCAERSACGDRDIAQLLKETVNEQIQERGQQIGAAIHRLSTEPETQELPTSEGRDSKPTARPPLRHRDDSASSTAERGVATGTIVRDQGSSWWLPAIAGLLVLAVLAFVARGSLSPEEPSVVAPVAATPTREVPSEKPAPQNVGASLKETSTPKSKPEPAPVTVRVESVPMGARVRVDGGEERQTPFSLTVAPSSEAHQLVASADGYQESSREVVFDQDRNVTLRMSAIKRRPSKPKHKKRKRTVAPRPKPKPKLARKPAATVATPPTIKRRRTLDEENPFAD